MSSFIEGPLGLNIDQLETIHALVGLRDGKRKRSDNLPDRCSSFLRLRQPTSAPSIRTADNIDLDGKFDSVLNQHRDGMTVDYPTGEPPTSKDFCFIFPDDQEYLSEYLFLLFTQVKKGIMDDTDRALRKQRPGDASRQLNYGFRCKHCGGAERGSYFPSTKKNLQACTATLHTHLITCNHVPAAVVRALKVTKSSHKHQVQSKRQGTQAVFFSKLWERIHGDFNGVDDTSLHRVVEKVNLIVDQSTLKSTKSTASPNVVSCEVCKDKLVSGEMTATFSDEDFGLAIQLLQMPYTPNCTKIFEGAPDVDITPEPVCTHPPSGAQL